MKPFKLIPQKILLIESVYYIWQTLNFYFSHQSRTCFYHDLSSCLQIPTVLCKYTQTLNFENPLNRINFDFSRRQDIVISASKSYLRDNLSRVSVKISSKRLWIKTDNHKYNDAFVECFKLLNSPCKVPKELL